MGIIRRLLNRATAPSAFRQRLLRYKRAQGKLRTRTGGFDEVWADIRDNIVKAKQLVGQLQVIYDKQILDPLSDMLPRVYDLGSEAEQNEGLAIWNEFGLVLDQFSGLAGKLDKLEKTYREVSEMEQVPDEEKKPRRRFLKGRAKNKTVVDRPAEVAVLVSSSTPTTAA